EELKATVEKMQISNLPGLISEVQHAIDNINQKEFFEHDDETKLMVNAAMMDIKFNFTKIGEEEMKMISGGVELKDKYNKVLQEFMDNMDQDDPEYLTLLEAFRARMKDHGFVLDNIEQFYQRTKDLDEILDKLKALQKKNKVLLNKYKGDAKFARVHKRIQEENVERSKKNEKPIVSTQDTELLDMLIYIKDCVDQKVYDRNDILKKDAYFEKTVMVLVSETLDKLKLENERQDRMFIMSRIVKQYLDQYKETYPAA
ncbi:MAG: type I restriction endonuclease subunit R, partial [Eubacterium sp.]|nr:type I restriction endonuclease subunit R [Eubacterium sp.]